MGNGQIMDFKLIKVSAKEKNSLVEQHQLINVKLTIRLREAVHNLID